MSGISMATTPSLLKGAEQEPQLQVYLSQKLGLTANGDRQELFVHGFVESGELDLIEIHFLNRVVFGIKYHGYSPGASARYPFAAVLRRRYRSLHPPSQADWQFEVHVKDRQGRTRPACFLATPLPDGRAATLSVGTSRKLTFSDTIPPAMIHSERVISGGQRLAKVVGWAVSLTTVRAIGISFDGGSLRQASLGYARPDVARWRPEYLNAKESGFELVVKVPRTAPTEIAVTLISDEVTCYTSDLFVDLNVGLPSNGLLFHCDTAYVFSDGLIFVSGWALADRPIKSIDLTVDDQRVGVADLGIVRDDVAAIHREITNSRNSGFQVIAKLGKLSSGSHQLMLSAADSSGNRRNLKFEVETVDRHSLLQSDVISVPPEIGVITLIADCLQESDSTSSMDFSWSSEQRELAYGLVDGKTSETYPLQTALANVQLAAWNRGVTAVPETGGQILMKNAAVCLSNDATFMDMLFTQFVLRKYKTVASMLVARYRPACSLVISVEDNKLGSTVVECRFELPKRLQISFDVSIFRDEKSFVRTLYLAWIFPQLAMYTRVCADQNGRVLINQWDCGIMPGLAYSDYRSDYFLIPDPQFVSTEGYRSSRQIAEDYYSPWQERTPIAFWRGATTGLPLPPEAGWRGLPRIALCELASSRPDIFDAGISNIVQLSDVDSELIKTSGLMRRYTPFHEFFRYKYHIDIDGNSNSWPGLFHKLLTGSPVLKVGSPRGYRQWYYHRLTPWINFVPIASDMSDLVEKVLWLRKNDETASKIGEAGRRLANSLKFQTELMYGTTVIREALRHFDRL